MGEVLGGDPFAGVGDLDSEIGCVGRRDYFHPTEWRGVAKSVVEEVGEHLRKSLWVGVQRGQVGGDVRCQLDVLGLVAVCGGRQCG